ncbi:PTS transporter subunit EIIC [Ligilactobacillus sp. WILCCON 0076]|uniref:Permease IIC component n=1 Tax=Ligilactobacillus ubinensis TaxID=2876789 RepID=A0A9X2FH24_9LACO|nr:PTS transporter subunit EIIC [Ligilactobacillus ubinensis]MCP0885714.1 PTS transporter subunit EIIC [Ligilactobacillus ubinensis]
MQFNKIQNFMESKISPFATKFGNSKLIRAISTGLMYTLPLTLTASIFSIFAKFPIPSVDTYLTKIGIVDNLNAIIGGTMNSIAIFVTAAIAYAYIKISDSKDANPFIGGLLAVGIFIALLPQTVGKTSALNMTYLGSSGMFLGIVLGLVTAKLYIILSGNKKLIIKMPDGVPPMVAESFKPLLVSFILLLLALVTRIGISYTPAKTLYSLVNTFITTPLMALGTSPFAWLGIAIIANTLFFFGIHPNAINGALTPILLSMALTNLHAYQLGKALPYKTVMIVDQFLNNDAVGSTLCLLIAIFIFCKSERYRKLAKLTVVPNLFNINEPVIFGLPIVLNPVLFIPFFLSTAISGLIGWIGAVTGFISYYNPAFALGIPWTVPKFITTFFVTGWQGLVLRIVSMTIMVLLYAPFIKMLDNKELEIEAKKDKTEKTEVEA